MRRSPHRSLVLLLPALAAGCLWACGTFQPRPRHILLMTVDSLRLDLPGLPGGGAPETPNMKTLAAESTRFRRAVTTAPITLPALASLMTGTLPPRHGVRFDTGYRLDPDFPVMAERVAEAGYRTAAVVGSSNLGRISGLDQGFGAFIYPFAQVEGAGNLAVPLQAVPGFESRVPARELASTALDWVRIMFRDRTFLWIHFMDLHNPYQKREAPEDAWQASYREALAMVDREIGRVLDTYRQLGILEDTLVILVADHGESLGEHGERTHSNFLYGATLRVPLLMRAGGRVRGRLPPGDVDHMAKIIDILPTVLELIGLEVDPSLPGESLLPVVSGGGQTGERIAYAETLAPLFRFGWTPLRSIEMGEWKYIEGGEEVELYHLTEDPGEERNRASEEPEIRMKLAAALAGITSGEGRGDRIWESGNPLTPESRAGFLALLQEMAAARNRGRMAQAERILQGILEVDPGNMEAARSLAGIHRGRKEFPAAEKVMRGAVERHPGLAEANLVMGRFYSRSGRTVRAAAEYRSALEDSPGRIPVLLLAAQEELRAGRLEESAALAERAVDREPESAWLHYMAAEFYWEHLAYGRAMEHFQAASDLHPPSRAFYLQRIGACLRLLGRYEEALRAFRTAEKLSPGAKLSIEIGNTYLLMEEDRKALAEYENSLSPHDSPITRGLELVNLLSGRGKSDLALEVLEGLRGQFASNPEIYHVRGEIRMTERDLEGAEADFRASLRLDPGSGSALYNLARVALLRGDEAQALSYLEEALEVDDGSLRRFLLQDPFWRVEGDTPLGEFLARLKEAGVQGRPRPAGTSTDPGN